MNVFLKALQSNNQEAIKMLVMIIAHQVNSNMKDFQLSNLTDAQMAELNPLIRNGIYNVLFGLANYDNHKSSKEFIDLTIRSIPDNWQEPELIDDFKKAVELSNGKIVFNSEFLNDEYKTGNIYRVQGTQYIKVNDSFNLANVDYDERKKHKNKITAQLRKEHYNYDYSLDAYVKQGYS